MIATRSPIVQTGVRAATPLALLVAAYLFFAGHNQPGGGFAAGLVLGALVALRAVAGIERRIGPAPLLSVGIVVACLVGIVPMVAGEPLLDQVVVERDLPLLGTVKSGSALVFDFGVTLVVVGLVMAVVDGLGARRLGIASASGAPGDADDPLDAEVAR